jgi:hypothetical protein
MTSEPQDLPALSSRRVSPRVVRSALPLVLLLLAAACGHPATEAECQLVVDRNVELQIKAMSAPPGDVEKEKARVRAEMDPMLKSCVGRRITDKKLACVKAAQSVKELDECFR